MPAAVEVVCILSEACTDAAGTNDEKKHTHILRTAQQRQGLERQYGQQHGAGGRTDKKETGEF